jgi:hypothetical protein
MLRLESQTAGILPSHPTPTTTLPPCIYSIIHLLHLPSIASHKVPVLLLRRPPRLAACLCRPPQDLFQVPGYLHPRLPLRLLLPRVPHCRHPARCLPSHKGALLLLLLPLGRLLLGLGTQPARGHQAGPAARHRHDVCIRQHARQLGRAAPLPNLHLLALLVIGGRRGCHAQLALLKIERPHLRAGSRMPDAAPCGRPA